MRRYLFAIGIAAVLSAGVVGISQSQLTNPQDRLGRALAGKRDPDGAMKQAHRLMAAMKSVNGDWKKVDRKLLFHPDQKLVEIPRQRDRNAFIPLDDPFYEGRILFLSTTYMNANLKYEGGDLITSNPTGFMIVGYADGNVAKVPVSQLRYYNIHRTLNKELTDVWLYVFPGMEEYGTADLKPIPRENAITLEREKPKKKS